MRGRVVWDFSVRWLLVIGALFTVSCTAQTTTRSDVGEDSQTEVDVGQVEVDAVTPDTTVPDTTVPPDLEVEEVDVALDVPDADPLTDATEVDTSEPQEDVAAETSVDMTPEVDVAPCPVCAGPVCEGDTLVTSECAQGMCVETRTSCAPYGCESETACAARCVADGDDCAAGFLCATATGTCVSELPSGETCLLPGDCATGNCVDGYCCSGECNGTCEACDLFGTEGTCSPIAREANPDVECLGDSGCHGTCNGNRGCAYPGQTTSCGQCLQCDGAGSCVDVAENTDPFTDCGGEVPCGLVCDGAGGCGLGGAGVQCGLACQQCDGAGSCLADCSDVACQSGIAACQCQVAGVLACGDRVTSSLAPAADTRDLWDTYGDDCTFTSPMDGEEKVYSFSLPSGSAATAVTIQITSGLCSQSATYASVLDGSFDPCDPTKCVQGQAQGPFM